MGAFSRLTGAHSADPARADRALGGNGHALGRADSLGVSALGVSAVGQHVQQILDTATKAAADIEAKAQADAAAHARESQLRVDREIEERRREFATFARKLAARAERLQQEVDELNTALAEGAQQTRQPPPASGTPQPEERPQDMSAARRAELLAAQMAAAGSGRLAIETALRNDLGIEEPTALVDRVLS